MTTPMGVGQMRPHFSLGERNGRARSKRDIGGGFRFWPTVAAIRFPAPGGAANRAAFAHRRASRSAGASTRQLEPILESASLFLPLAALRRIPRKQLACFATGGAAPLSPILDFTPGVAAEGGTSGTLVTEILRGPQAETVKEKQRQFDSHPGYLSTFRRGLTTLGFRKPRPAPNAETNQQYPALSC